VSQAEYSSTTKIALNGDSPGWPQKVTRRLPELPGDFHVCDFVSLMLSGIGFALGIYAITIP
jgi:hypothetical protein